MIPAWLLSKPAQIVGVVLLIVAAFALGRCDGVRSERAHWQAEIAKANQKAVQRDSAAKEAAAEQRAKDTATIDGQKQEQIDALQGDDAGVRLRAACQRLRASGRGEATLPEQCRSSR